MDPSGNAYLTGETFSTDFPITSGAFQTSYGSGGFDAFLAKYENLALPVLSLSEMDVAFPAQGVATTSPARTLTLANVGDAELVIGDIAVSGDFVQTNNCSGTLTPGTRCALSVAFTPSELGPRNGTVTIASNAYGAPHVISLAGTGVAAPALTLSVVSLAFSEQNLGTTSTSQTLTLSNTGLAVLAITSIAAGGDFSETHTCGPLLPVEGTCTITVAFTPTVPGTALGAITINDNAPGSPHGVSLSGTGMGPAVSLSPTRLRFADQPLGTTSAPLPVKLTNSGQAPLAITSISSSGNYAQTNDCLSPLAARAYCTINVTFTPPPTVAGGQSGTLIITDNAVGSPHTVALGGVGVGPVAILSATSLNFGNQPAGTTSAPRLVNLSNTGNAPMTIASITVSGDFGQTNNCPSTLAARGYCTMTVTFKPAATGPRIGAITVVDNAAGSPHGANLIGTGVSP